MSKHPQTIKRKIATLDQRSDEVKEVLGKAPSWVVRAGITVIFIVITLLIVGSALISYNDVVSTPIVIGEKSKPVVIKSSHSGVISDVMVSRGQPVSEGDVLAMLKNSVNLEDVLRLTSKLEQYNVSIRSLDTLYMIFPANLNLGHLQNTYQDFVLKYEGYIISILDSSNPGAMLGRMQKLQFQRLNRALQSLKTHIQLWKDQFLITAPISGRITFINDISPFEVVREGKKLFTLGLNDIGEVLGMSKITMDKAQKIKRGQHVIVKLLEYPFEEWGSLQGYVITSYYVSEVNGGPFQKVEVKLNGLTTSAGKQIQLEHEMQGTAQIITEELTVLQRVFYKFNNLFK
ncbi:HlyD family efflux transporter periplasmic adaptor subunit [Fulvivirga ligni]|uniref:HlyD family efflux transporter periplasmic adaptor subunit n=1 Tax=Fulvivirga ligni TaxID=2904246 RepID=UPI001F3DADBA|nr:HlyD family efflux transporter periplasmic adaptor subunit [Fulvivirga ligni]UII21566.1 HlyD family efflux transporter periplasmic adaptor subunit [Fulvivirga ligni]